MFKVQAGFKSHIVNDEVWWDFSLVSYLSKQFGRRKFGEFTEQPIVTNIKVANWQIKVWQISSICQIHQTKVPPNFHHLIII